MDYNCTLTLEATKLTEEVGDDLIEAFVDYHPAAGMGRAGRVEVVLTLPAESARQAITTALALAAATNLVVIGVEAIPTDLWDERASAVEVPELLSVNQAADLLGVTRQAVSQRLDSGSLRGVRVGKVWVIPRANLA